MAGPAKKSTPAKKTASSSKGGSTLTLNLDETGDDVQDGAAVVEAKSTAGQKATREVKPAESNSDFRTVEQQVAYEKLAVAEARKIAAEANGQDAETLNKLSEENDKKESEPGFTDKHLEDMLRTRTGYNLAKEEANYVSDQANIFNVAGLSAPAVPVVSASAK